MPRVSVITPTYNRPDLLCQAVESVMAQTFTDWEMIVINDGSEIDQANLLHGVTDPRVRYLWQEHAGRSAARNRGIAEAQGEYIAFLDDDDLYLQHKLTRESAFLDEHLEVDLVACGTLFTTPNGEEIETLRPWKFHPDITLFAFLDSCLFTGCAVMIRRGVLERMESWFDPSIDLYEDWDFYLRLSLIGTRMTWLQEVGSICRSHRQERLSILVEQNRSGERVLDKLFGQPDLPAEVRERQKYAYTNYFISCACRAYLSRCDRLGQRELLRALIIDSELASTSATLLFNGIAWFANSPYCYSAPNLFIDYVCDHLPTPLAVLSSRRDQMKLMACHELGVEPD